MPITNGIITLARAKEQIGTGFLAADDTKLERYVEAATPVMEDLCQAIVPRAVTEVVSGGDDVLDLRHHAISITSITNRGTLLIAGTDYHYDAEDDAIYGGTQISPRLFAFGHRNLVVVYQAGYTPIPENLILATADLVAHWWRQGRISGRSKFSGETGELVTPSGYGVPNRVFDVSRPHHRHTGIA